MYVFDNIHSQIFPTNTKIILNGNTGPLSRKGLSVKVIDLGSLPHVYISEMTRLHVGVTYSLISMHVAF